MKVIIVGSGFGGIRAARNLSHHADFDVTLVSERTCFEYHAALYRSATGRSVLEVDLSLRDIFGDGKVEVVKDKISRLDPTAKELVGESGSKYKYEVLILALGAATEYFGIAGLAEFSYGIKSIHQALELKNHLHQELASGKPDLNYVVVGGGPTGVELAGELVFYLADLRRKHKAKQTKFNVMLVEAAPRILPNLPEAVSRRIEKRLKEIGVKVITSTAVKGETADSLQLPEGNVSTHTVIWTAGVGNNPFFKANQQHFKLGKANRVEVDGELQGAPDVYILGDSAATPQTGWAQTAIYDANFVTENLKRKLRKLPPLKYNPPKPIGAIPVGPGWCAVSSDRRQAYGQRGWIVRRWLDLKLFNSLLPRSLAVRTWMYGNQKEEQCEICAKR